MTSVVAQTTLTGKVTEEGTGEELISATIVVTQNRNFIQGQTTDFDGNFSIKVDPGIYDIEVSYTGFYTQRITDIKIEEGNTTKVDVQLKSGVITTCGVYYGWVIPLITQYDNTQGIKMRSDKIKKQPTRDIREMSILTPGVTFSQ